MLLPFALFLAISCSFGPDPGEVAAQSAKQYYDYLVEEKYDAFVDGQYHADSLPDEYRNQLIANAKMFVAKQQQDHRGIRHVQVVQGKVDSTKQQAEAFLMLTYGDSTSEEVLVPMVLKNGLWYLR